MFAPQDPPAAAPAAAPAAEPTTAAEPPTIELNLSAESVTTVKLDGKQLTFSRPAGFVPVGSKQTVNNRKIHVPRRPEEITAEWLTTVYQARGFLTLAGSVRKVDVKPLGGGLGVMGDICIAEVELEGAASNAPRGFVAKFCPQVLYGFPKPIAETMAKGIFGTEAHWYNDFLENEIGLPKPDSYFVGAKLKHRRPWRRSPVFCMLIELMPRPLYSLAGGCDNLPHLLAVTEGLATFHALWWEAKKRPPVEYVPSATDLCYVAVPAIGFVSYSSLDALGACFGDTYAPVLAWKSLLKGKHRAIVRRMFRPPLTLTHGDVHLDNIFFDDKWKNASGGGGYKLIDFGNMQFLQGMFDIASFLGTCLEPDVRRQHEKTLIEAYHAKLLQGLSKEQAAAYPLERCWFDYRLNLWRMVINVAFVAKTQFLKNCKAGTGMFAAEPSKEDRKLKETYDARNRRLVSAIVDNGFEKVIASVPRGCCF